MDREEVSVLFNRLGMGSCTEAEALLSESECLSSLSAQVEILSNRSYMVPSLNT